MSLAASIYLEESQSWVHPLQPIPPPDSDGSFESVHAQTWKRRAPRASLACDACREKKKACDEGRPCASCDKANVPCRYSSSKSTRRVVDVEETIHGLAQYSAKIGSQTKGVGEKVEVMDARVEAIEAQLSHRDQEIRELRESLNQVLTKNESSGGKGAAISAVPLPCPTMRREIWSSRKQCHFSGAHNLISLWPTVHGLLYSAGIPVDPAYVSIAEDKGAWHLKQGHNSIRRTQHILTPYFEHAESRREESGLYKSNDKRKAADISHHVSDVEPQHGSMPRTSRHKRLLQSYIEHMHLLHPIVNLKLVESLFEQYFQEAPDRVDSPANYERDASESASPERGHKRRRAGGTDSLDGTKKYYPSGHVSAPALDSALLSLILALGEICEYKCSRSFSHRRASTSTDGTLSNNSSFSSQTISPADTSITQPSPRLFAKSTGNSPMLSNVENARVNSPRVAPRNVDSASPPGISHYERAAQIMGQHADGNDLVHAQIAILAGLYKGQIGQVRESMNWICMAGRIVQFLLHRYNFIADNRDSTFSEDIIEYRSRMQERMKGPEDDLIILAAWTCIQLESDILAELPFPPSGILAYENEIPWPVRIPGADVYSKIFSQHSATSEPFSSHNVLMGYTSQLWLRKQLNSIQEQVHGHAGMIFEPTQLRSLLEEYQETLDSWRTHLPTELTWDDEDAPSESILSARVRAKYWGACFLVHRPYLDYMLHAMPAGGDQGESVRTVAMDSYGSPRSDAAARFFEAITAMSEADVVKGATRCIEAAFNSTHAFDGISHDLIVTNLHGTAHAQFGNILVLVAAYHGSALLRPIIKHARLSALIKHELSFLDRQPFLPHTCRIDRAILKKLLTTLADAT